MQTNVPVCSPQRNLLLRNNCLTLHRLFAGSRSPKGPHASNWLTIFGDLEIVASIRGKTIQLGVVILAVVAIGPLSGLRQICAVGTVLYAGVAGRIPG